MARVITSASTLRSRDSRSHKLIQIGIEKKLFCTLSVASVGYVTITFGEKAFSSDDRLQQQITAKAKSGNV